MGLGFLNLISQQMIFILMKISFAIKFDFYQSNFNGFIYKKCAESRLFLLLIIIT